MEFRILNIGVLLPRNRQQASPAVARALATLEALAHTPDGMTLAELSRTLGEAKSSLLNVLRTLEDGGFVSRNPETKRYHLGPQLLVLSAAYARQSSLLREFYALAPDIARELGETVQLAVLRGRFVLYVAKQEGTQWVRLASEVGTLLPAHATSLGKCLLAWLDEAALDALLAGIKLEQLTPYTITDLAQLKTELATVRARGYAVDRGETLEEVRCVGAPIHDASGRVVAAMSISVPSSRFDGQREQELIEAIRAAAATLSAHLGYREPEYRRPLTGSAS